MDLRGACRAAGIGVVAASEHTGKPRLHRGVPALTTRLVVSLGAPIEVQYGGQTRHRQAVVAGLMRPGIATPSMVLQPEQPTVYVELAPAALQRLTGVPLSELDAGGEDADAVLATVGSLVEDLGDHPAGQREMLMRVRLLDLMRRGSGVVERSDSLTALTMIGAGHGRLSVDELARRVHLSPRSLRHAMRRELGIGPKLASRVARLAAAVDRAGEGAESWAQIAADGAYHDQSHLVRDFNDLMRTTPTAWLAEEGRNLQGWRRPAR